MTAGRQPEQRTPPRPVRIVGAWEEDAPPAKTWGHGKPGAWLLTALVMAALFFVGLHVPLLWVRP